MDIALVILVALVFMAILVAFRKGGWQLPVSGFRLASHNVKSMWLRVLLGIMFGGLIQVLVPSELIAEWLGPASGLKGILTGSCVGIIVGGGGPFVVLPIIAAIYVAGAGVGPVIAFLVSISLIGVRQLITWQIPFLGTKIALTRYVVCFFIPPLAGLAGAAVYQLLNVV